MNLLSLSPQQQKKLKSAVGVLKQLSTQAKADAVKQQYGALLTELKELQQKIEEAQQELRKHTETYNQQLEKEKKAE